ncbi:unnamed protein product [Rhizopus stolonifer]
MHFRVVIVVSQLTISIRANIYSTTLVRFLRLHTKLEYPNHLRDHQQYVSRTNSNGCGCFQSEKQVYFLDKIRQTSGRQCQYLNNNS